MRKVGICKPTTKLIQKSLGRSMITIFHLPLASSLPIANETTFWIHGTTSSVSILRISIRRKNHSVLHWRSFTIGQNNTLNFLNTVPLFEIRMT